MTEMSPPTRTTPLFHLEGLEEEMRLLPLRRKQQEQAWNYELELAILKRRSKAAKSARRYRPMDRRIVVEYLSMAVERSTGGSIWAAEIYYRLGYFCHLRRCRIPSQRLLGLELKRRGFEKRKDIWIRYLDARFIDDVF